MTTTSPNTQTLCNCETCETLLKAAEAQVSRRALSGRTLCWRCRRRQYPTFTVPHQLPVGFSATGRWSGYGRPEVAVTRTTDGRTWTGGGLTDYDAFRNATAQARQEGAAL
jgi:hypothetical protein